MSSKAHKVLLHFPPGLNEGLKDLAARLTLEEGAYLSKNALIVRTLGALLDGSVGSLSPDVLRVRLKAGTIETYRALASVWGQKPGLIISKVLAGALDALKAKEANWVSIKDYGQRRGWMPADQTKTDTRVLVPDHRGAEIRALAEEQGLAISDTVELLLLYAPTLGLFAPPKKGK